MNEDELKAAYVNTLKRWFERNSHYSTELLNVLLKGDPSIPFSLADMCELTNTQTKAELELTIHTALDNIFRKYYISPKHISLKC